MFGSGDLPRTHILHSGNLGATQGSNITLRRGSALLQRKWKWDQKELDHVHDSFFTLDNEMGSNSVLLHLPEFLLFPFSKEIVL